MKDITTTIKSTFPQIYRVERNNGVSFTVSMRSRRMGLNKREFFSTEAKARAFIKEFERDLHEKGAANVQRDLVVTDTVIAGYVARLSIYQRPQSTESQCHQLENSRFDSPGIKPMDAENTEENTKPKDRPKLIVFRSFIQWLARFGWAWVGGFHI